MPDLRLPRTVDFSYATEDPPASTAEWLRHGNFRGRLMFEEWSDFESTLQNVVAFVDRLRDSQCADAESFLRAIRRHIREGFQSENEIKTDLRSNTTAVPKIIFESYESCDFSRWVFVAEKDISTDFFKAGLATPTRANINIPEPVSGVPDVGLFCSRDEVTGEGRKAPLATVEVKGSLARLVPDELRTRSARRLAEYFTVEFDKPASEVSGPTRRFAQALNTDLMNMVALFCIPCCRLLERVNALTSHKHKLVQAAADLNPAKMWQIAANLGLPSLTDYLRECVVCRIPNANGVLVQRAKKCLKKTKGF